MAGNSTNGGSGLRGRVAAKREEHDNGGGAQDGAGNGTVAKRADPLRALLESMSGEFAAALPRLIPLDHFMRVALTGLKTTEGLAQCSQSSLFAALLKCATAGLLPCTEQAAIIPFGQTATFVPQYQGYIEIFHNTGNVARVELDWIYEADRWEYIKGDSPCFRHWPNLKAAARGDKEFAYAFLRYKDGTRSDIIILSRVQAEHIRDTYSKGYRKAESSGKKDSPWHTNFDDQWLKTCIRRLAKYVPKSPQLRAVLDGDEPDDGSDYSAPAARGPSTIPGEVIRDDPPAAASQATPGTDSEKLPDDLWAGAGDGQ